MKLVDLRKDLIHLRGNIVAHPKSYEDEFNQFYNYFESCVAIFKIHPMRKNENLINLAFFICEMSKFYKNICFNFGQILIDLIKNNCSICHHEIRSAFYKCAMILFSNELLESSHIIDISFLLLETNDKNIRTIARTFLVKHFKDVLKRPNRNEIISVIYSKFHKKISDEKAYLASQVIFDVLCNIYSKNIAIDHKIANIIADACFSKNEKISFKAVLFLLGKDNILAELSESSQNSNENELNAKIEKKRHELNAAKISLKTTRMRMKMNVKSYSKKRALHRLEKDCKNKTGELMNLSDYNNNDKYQNYRIIDQIFDPYKFSEKLLEQIHKRHVNPSFKMIEFELLANIISKHSLILSDYYSLLQTNIKLGKKDSTKYMYFAVLSLHKSVPDYIIERLIHCISFNFVSEGNRSDEIACGLNSIRQIVLKNSNGMTKDMAESLAKFVKVKDKMVTSAARSLINAIQKCDPLKLPKKYAKRQKPQSNELEYDDCIYKDEGDEENDLNLQLSDSDEDESTIDDQNNQTFDEKVDSLSEIEESDQDSGKKITLNDIETVSHQSKKKSSQILRKKISKDKCDKKFKNWRMNPSASTTNREKQKNKNAGMVGHKLRLAKSKKSLHQKCMELKTKLKKDRKFKNKL